MPITRCSNCGTEDSMSFESDFRANRVAVSAFLTCPICADPVCGSCFISEDNSCGQCVEALTNGLQFEIDTLHTNLSSAVNSQNHYIRRRSIAVLKKVLQDIS